MKHAAMYLATRLPWLTVLTGVLGLTACAQPTPAPFAAPPIQMPPPPPAIAEVASDAWIGQWNGPEGTFLRIAGGQGRYEITIQNLDGPRRFPGRGAGDLIEFERDGTVERLTPTSGADTGMKWLSDKQRCLTVRRGEGYCRD